MSVGFDGLPGAVGVSHLAVYGSASPDGVRGGSAHVHLSCTESYVVIGGRGRLQTLSYSGFQEIDLHPMQIVWFTPGVVHRLVNTGDLEIIIIMQNGGLSEAGDCVLALPNDYLREPDRYREVVALPPNDMGSERVEAHARQRKDLSVQGFVELRSRFEQEGHSALDEFYLAASNLTKDQVAEWKELWHSGAERAAATTAVYLGALAQGDLSHLRSAVLQETQVRPGSSPLRHVWTNN